MIDDKFVDQFVDDDSSNKKKNKKELYCSNCGKDGHLYRNCDEPITSFGVILFSLTDKKLINDVIDKFKNKNETDVDTNIINIKNKENGINIENMEDIGLFCKYKNNVSFLMIRRKHTLGYLEFIRGHYNIDNVDGIIFLFKQMTNEEIKKIGKSSFDDLWDEVWGNSKDKQIHKNEYIQSKNKYEKLKSDGDGYLNLDFYINNVEPIYNIPEWGFPKGRRNYKETDIECAIREFKEETGLLDEEYTLLDKIIPFEEKFIGTNGINYKHIYYVALLKIDKQFKVDQSNIYQKDEIGDIGIYGYEEGMKIIRPYHVERQTILTQLYIYIINTLIQLDKNVK